MPITNYDSRFTIHDSRITEFRKEISVDEKMEMELEKVKTVLEDFSKKVVDVVKKGKGEADKVTRIAQVKIEIGSMGRQQKDLYQELGELFYRNLDKPSKKGEIDIAEAVAHLKELEKNTASLNRTLKALREDKPLPKKRGRPPKAAAGDQAPKRRGRPPKAAKVSAAPKKRGRPPKAAAAKTQSAAPKRRGRPPKAASS